MNLCRRVRLEILQTRVDAVHVPLWQTSSSGTTSAFPLHLDISPSAPFNMGVMHTFCSHLTWQSLEDDLTRLQEGLKEVRKQMRTFHDR